MKRLFTLILLCLAPHAMGAALYDSPGDDGNPGGIVAVPIDGTPVALNLYIDGGPVESASSDKCTGSGTGDELCAWSIRLGVDGGMTIDGFTPAAGVVFNASADTLRANGLDPLTPSAGPQRVGTLIVAANGHGELRLHSGLAVRSDLAGDTLAAADIASTNVLTDSDGDGVPDADDNCTLLANADQRDSNDDGFGNLCDADLNNDLIVNVLDLGLFRSAFFSADADADFNGDGVVNVVDLGTLRVQFFGPPGPSGEL